MKREKVIILGAGFIGGAIARRLSDGGLEVVVVSRAAPPFSERVEGVHYIELNVEDPRVLKQHRALRGADAVVYALTGLLPAQSNARPLEDAFRSLGPLLTTLEWLRNGPETLLVFLSSGGAIYGNPETLPIAENHSTSPLTSYGVMKLAAEKYLDMYHQLYGIRSRVLRVSNAYGPGQRINRGQGVIGEFVNAVARDIPVTIFGSGRNIRDYIYVDDVAGAVQLALIADVPPVINVGSGIGVSLLQIVDLLETISGRAISVDFQPARSFDIESVVLDVSAFMALMGSSLTDFADGLERTWTNQLLPGQSKTFLI